MNKRNKSPYACITHHSLHTPVERFPSAPVIIVLPRWCSGKESACSCRRHRKFKFSPCVRNNHWSRKWLSTAVFWPGNWTEETGGLQSMVSQKVGHNWVSIYALQQDSKHLRPMNNHSRPHFFPLSYKAGVPNLQYLMTDDVRWSWCRNNRNKKHNKCNALISSWSHPQPQSMEKLSSTQPVPGANKAGDCCKASPFPLFSGLVTIVHHSLLVPNCNSLLFQNKWLLLVNN